MKPEEKLKKKILISEKRILELNKSEDLKKISASDKIKIAKFYETKSLNRLQTAKLIYETSASEERKKDKRMLKGYSDYAEVVASAYYAMYYIVHSYLAATYSTKLREDTRGVHAITQHIVVYFLVKTKKLAHHLYNEYLQTCETAAQIQKIEDFQKEAYRYATKYDESRNARESFTYKVTLSAEEHHAKHAIETAEEFINTIRQLIRGR